MKLSICLFFQGDIRSLEVHQKTKGKCPGKPWFRISLGKIYVCLHKDCDGPDQLELPDQESYWSHVQENHWVEKDLVINCNYCKEKFPLIEMMKYHVKKSHAKTVSFESPIVFIHTYFLKRA